MKLPLLAKPGGVKPLWILVFYLHHVVLLLILALLYLQIT